DERRCHVLLRGAARALRPQCEHLDDVRSEQDPEQCDGDEERDGDGHDRADGFVVLPFDMADELRHERGREHAAEQELVEHVRRLVGVAVRAGERAGADRVRDRRHAQETRDPREGGAEPDDRARPQQTGRGLTDGADRVAHGVELWPELWPTSGAPGGGGGPRRRGGGGGGGRGRRWRRRRTSWAHQPARKSPAPTVRISPTLLTKKVVRTWTSVC